MSGQLTITQNQHSGFLASAWDWTTDKVSRGVGIAETVVMHPVKSGEIIADGAVRGVIKTAPDIAALAIDLGDKGLLAATGGRIGYSGSLTAGVNSGIDGIINFGERHTPFGQITAVGKGQEDLQALSEFAGGMLVPVGGAFKLGEGALAAVTARTLTAAGKAEIPAISVARAAFASVAPGAKPMGDWAARSLMYRGKESAEAKMMDLAQGGQTERATQLFARTLKKGVDPADYSAMKAGKSVLPPEIQTALVASYRLRNVGNPISQVGARFVDKFLSTTSYATNFGMRSVLDTALNTVGAAVNPMSWLKVATLPVKLAFNAVLHPVATTRAVVGLGTKVALATGAAVAADEMFDHGRITNWARPTVVNTGLDGVQYGAVQLGVPSALATMATNQFRITPVSAPTATGPTTGSGSTRTDFQNANGGAAPNANGNSNDIGGFISQWLPLLAGGVGALSGGSMMSRLVKGGLAAGAVEFLEQSGMGHRIANEIGDEFSYMKNNHGQFKPGGLMQEIGGFFENDPLMAAGLLVGFMGGKGWGDRISYGIGLAILGMVVENLCPGLKAGGQSVVNGLGNSLQSALGGDWAGARNGIAGIFLQGAQLAAAPLAPRPQPAPVLAPGMAL
jgi:hypothetical protein